MAPSSTSDVSESVTPPLPAKLNPDADVFESKVDKTDPDVAMIESYFPPLVEGNLSQDNSKQLNPALNEQENRIDNASSENLKYNPNAKEFVPQILRTIEEAIILGEETINEHPYQLNPVPNDPESQIDNGLPNNLKYNPNAKEFVPRFPSPIEEAIFLGDETINEHPYQLNHVPNDPESQIDNGSPNNFKYNPNAKEFVPRFPSPIGVSNYYNGGATYYCQDNKPTK